MKLIVLGLATVLATLAGSFSAMELGSNDRAKPADPPVVADEVVRLEQSSVPIVREGKVQGYVLAQISFSAAAADVKASKALLTVLATEAAFAAVFEEVRFDFTSLKTIEIADLSERILKKANNRIGRGTITKVFIESMSFLDQESVRCRRN